MNGIADPVSPPPKRSTSPRPPTVGKEVKQFHDNSWFQGPYKIYSHSMDDQRMPPCGAGGVQDQPCLENAPTQSSDCKKADNLPNPSPPPPIKWAQSLLCLLEDLQGVSLFQQFLQQEGQDQDSRSLSFWFACNGVKKTDSTDKEGLVKLINVIYEKKVKRISAIRNETKEEIKQKLLSNTGVDATIFDTAQHEVEAYIMKTTYPNFLKSDIYIQHLGGWQNESLIEKECAPLTPEVQQLPTVHEDSELHISSNNKMHLTKENLWQRNRIPVGTKLRSEGPASLYLKSPYGNYGCYHSKYSSYLPASAQDSELQSLSSDAQTDDNMSLTDSSSVDYNMCSRNKQKRPQKAMRHNTFMNKDRLTHSSFIPRTQRLPQSMPPQSPKEFHEVLVKKLNRVLEEQKSKEKLSEKVKMIEGNEGNQTSNQRISHKSYTATDLDSFLTGPSEENDQEILDRHCSRVFDGHSGQQSPAMMSPGCISPPTVVPPSKLQSELHEFCPPPVSSSINYEHGEKLIGLPSGYPYSCSQVTPFAVPCNIRHRRDVHSNDSGAMVNCASDDSLYFKGHGYFHTGSMETIDHAQVRRSKELKRNASKKFSSMTDSSSSCVDSGISVTCESVPPSYSKVTHWLETKRCNSDQEREHVWKNSSSPVLSSSSSSRKPVMYNSSRSGMTDNWPYAPPQSFMQDSVLPMQQVPDTTSNLMEARRILEVENRAKMKIKSTGGRNSHDTSRMKFSKACDPMDDCLSHRKQSRKSCPSTMAEGAPFSNANNDLTVIGYSFGRDTVPYLSKLPGKSITLKQFKTLLSKKGDYRYFFKKARDDFGTGVVFEEVTEDYEILPLWEGKVFCVIETIDESST